MKILLCIVSIIIGALLLYGGWAIYTNIEPNLEHVPRVDGVSGFFAYALLLFASVYFQYILAVLCAVTGIGFLIAGVTGLLNSAGRKAPGSTVTANRLARIATIRRWISRAGWLVVLGGTGYFAVQLLRNNSGADLPFLDVFALAVVVVLLGFAIVLLCALGSLVARIIVQRI